MRRGPAPARRASRCVLTAAAALLALLATAVPALASPAQIYEDCQDGRLDQRYSASDYRQALKNMPGDLDEYTNCREVIRSAAQGVTGGGGGSGPGGAGPGGYGPLPPGQGGLPLNPQSSQPVSPYDVASAGERKALDRARAGADAGTGERASAPTTLAGAGIRPGQGSSSDLPTPIVVLLALIALGALAALVPRIRDLVVRRPAA